MGKRRSSYIKLKNGDSFEIEKSGGIINMACCDCGLVHNIAVARKSKKIIFTMMRDNRRTGQKRRYNKYDKK